MFSENTRRDIEKLRSARSFFFFFQSPVLHMSASRLWVAIKSRLPTRGLGCACHPAANRSVLYSYPSSPFSFLQTQGRSWTASPHQRRPMSAEVTRGIEKWSDVKMGSRRCGRCFHLSLTFRTGRNELRVRVFMFYKIAVIARSGCRL